MEFKLHSEFQPTGDQPQAIEALVRGFEEGNQFQTLLGVTGSARQGLRGGQSVSDPSWCYRIRQDVYYGKYHCKIK